MDAEQKTDAETIRDTHNLARFFAENHQVAWVLFAGAIAWGILSYFAMPQRKDPEIAIRTAVALAPWPGATAEDVEELVTRKIEEKVAENTNVTKIDSISRTGLSIVYVEVGEEVEDTDKEFDDISLRLDAVRGLPEGAGPIFFVKDFGDTAALMLTVASPLADELEVELRARGIRKAIERVRASASPATAGSRSTLLYLFAKSVSPRAMRHRLDMAAKFIDEEGVAQDIQLIEGPGYIGWDGVVESDEALLESAYRFIRSRLRVSELHPDSWGPVVVRDPAETEAKLATIAGSKYSYRELDDFTDLISRTFRRIPLVSKVTRSGVWEERVYLEYSQERLAAYGIRPFTLGSVLAARNITLSGGVLEIEGRNITIDPSGEFKSEQEIDEVLITGTDAATPVYLRDLGNIVRGYESPPRFLNFFTRRDDAGNWHRSRAITLAVQMRAGEQIGEFGAAVDEALAEVRQRLPEDLIMARTSDQPRQVTESINQFMDNLYQAILLVILVALVGFREWRATLLIALSIPLSIAIAFGMMNMLSIDLQQVSIAVLIIALGLLVDDPIVATDAIKRELAAGRGPGVAAWLGPTKLAKPMYFTTATAVVAYLPFLLLTGDKGRFLVSLPIVLACTLIASRLVAMTFVPFFGSLFLRPGTTPEPSMEEKRRAGVSGLYYRAGRFALDHRRSIFAGSLLFLALGGFFVTHLHTQFFPKDFSYLSYVEVWLPEDAPLSATNEAAAVAEKVIRDAAREYAEQHLTGDDGVPPETLESLTTFIGGGGPRFWFSIGPELQQLNYAQIIVRVRDKRMTRRLVGPLQRALSATVPGARVDVRELETGEPVGIPVEIFHTTRRQSVFLWAQTINSVMELCRYLNDV